MSFGVSPSPRPLSGSSLVIEVSTTVGFGSHTSVTTSVAVMSAILWLGGHSASRLSDSAMVGGVVSTTVTLAVHCALLVDPSVAVNVTVVAPCGKNVGASLVMVGLPSHAS